MPGGGLLLPLPLAAARDGLAERIVLHRCGARAAAPPPIVVAATVAATAAARASIAAIARVGGGGGRDLPDQQRVLAARREVLAAGRVGVRVGQVPVSPVRAANPHVVARLAGDHAADEHQRAAVLVRVEAARRRQPRGRVERARAEGLLDGDGACRQWHRSLRHGARERDCAAHSARNEIGAALRRLPRGLGVGERAGLGRRQAAAPGALRAAEDEHLRARLVHHRDTRLAPVLVGGVVQVVVAAAAAVTAAAATERVRHRVAHLVQQPAHGAAGRRDGGGGGRRRAARHCYRRLAALEHGAGDGVDDADATVHDGEDLVAGQLSRAVAAQVHRALDAGPHARLLQRRVGARTELPDARAAARRVPG